MREHVHIHRLFSSALVRSVRLLIIFGLISLVTYALMRGTVPKFSLFFLSWALMLEVFFHFSLKNLRPHSTVQQNDGKHPTDSFTHEAADTMLSSSQTSDVLRRLLSLPQCRFILERVSVTTEKFTGVPLSQEEWITESFTTSKNVNGTYVTSMDCLVAYLVKTEPQTKLLFSKEVNTEKLYDILIWARMTHPGEEIPMSSHARVAGDGIMDQLTTGWTPETKNYTTNFTYQALSSPRNMIGREKEYESLIESLTKPQMNNVLIVGEAGSGKEKLVETLAYDSYIGSLPSPVNHKQIITLMVGPLLAGAENRAVLEERLQAIIAELTHAGNIILSIPELQEIMGETSFDLNLSGALLPYLKGGTLPIIATMTEGNYKTYMEKNSLREVFSVITLPEPDVDQAKRMLYSKIPEIEKIQQVVIPYQTLVKVLELAHTFLPDDVLPGSALRLLSDVVQAERGNVTLRKKRVILQETVIEVVEGKVHAKVAVPKKEEKDLLLHLEEKLHERIIGQEKAVTAVAEAIRRLRSGVTKAERPISFLFLGPTGVGKTETAKALAELYFNGERNMLRLDMSEYVDEAGVHRLLGAPPGAGEERGELTERIHDNPYTLVLLDEFEKAHPKILDLFLQVFSDGRLTDNKGRTVSFTNAIIIATSNAGSEFIREAVKGGSASGKEFQEKLLEFLQTNHIFKPELLNRFDAVVTYQPLTQDQIQQVAKLLLIEVTSRMAAQDITVTYDDHVLGLIAKEGFDDEFGARPLRRYIQDTIEDMLAKLTLEEKLKRGNTITFSVDAAGELTNVIT